jgi:hypothetical protein
VSSLFFLFAHKCERQELLVIFRLMERLYFWVIFGIPTRFHSLISDQ